MVHNSRCEGTRGFAAANGPHHPQAMYITMHHCSKTVQSAQGHLRRSSPRNRAHSISSRQQHFDAKRKRGETHTTWVKVYRTWAKVYRLNLHFRSASALSLSATRTRRTAPLLGRTASAPAPLPCTAPAAPLRALLFVPHLRFVKVGWHQVVSRSRLAGITRSNHDTTTINTDVLLAHGGNFAKQNLHQVRFFLSPSNPLHVPPVVADGAQDSQKHPP